MSSALNSDAPPAQDPAQDADAAARRADRSAVLAVDAMGGDYGPKEVLDGLARAVSQDPGMKLLLHGSDHLLRDLLDERPALAAASEVVPCDSVVPMDARPSQALRSGRRSSMWLALDAVASGRAGAALSAGNTGALMTMATVRLRPAEGVERPAIAALWPSRNPAGFSVVLDVGADLRAGPENLVDYALMGAEYARIALGLERPRVGLLNVGVEEVKGPAALGDAAERLRLAAPAARIAFVGYVEGDKISGACADVIVTDGFTGNVALKTAEGTARLIGDFLRDALRARLAGKLAGLMGARAFRDFKRRIDPRRVNGGVFLGLNGVVVKSHGAADALGIAAAAALAARMARADVAGRIAEQVAKLRGSGDGGADDDGLGARDRGGAPDAADPGLATGSG